MTVTMQNRAMAGIGNVTAQVSAAVSLVARQYNILLSIFIEIRYGNGVYRGILRLHGFAYASQHHGLYAPGIRRQK